MPGVGFKVTVEGAGKLTQLLAKSQERVHRGIVSSLRTAVALVTRDAKLAAPHVSGRLRSSIRGRVEEGGPGRGGSGIVGTNSVYGRIQELGGTVKAVNTTYLTIPLDAAKTATGRTRGGARSFPNTFVLKSRAGRLIIMQKIGRGMRPLFLLVRQVRLQPNPYLKPALDRNRAAMRELFGRNVKAELVSD